MGEMNLPVLKGISLNIAEGEFIAIMGSSGSGKSTLLNIIGCLDSIQKGYYRFNGINIEQATDNELADIRNRKIGFVFQQFNLIPRINALRNVELPLEYAWVSFDERQKRAYEALKLVGLEDRIYHTPSQLSGGQQQRVAIARALVSNPNIIIADEPTGNLDSLSGKEIMKLFSELHMLGKSVVMVTHEREIAEYAKRIVRLCDGIIEKDERR
jgi:putative ABC transport system ATP-binding protein